MIMDSILKSPGNAFVYTEYKTEGGIGKYEKRWIYEMKLKKDSDGVVQMLIFGPTEKTRVPSGEAALAKWWKITIILKMNFHKNSSPTKQWTPKNNLCGDILHVLMTTTGAEGIDLHNVRQVHIIELESSRLKQVRKLFV